MSRARQLGPLLLMYAFKVGEAAGRGGEQAIGVTLYEVATQFSSEIAAIKSAIFGMI